MGTAKLLKFDCSLYTPLVAGIEEVEAQGCHELVPIGRQPISSTMSRLLRARKRTRSRSVPSRSLGDSSLAPLMIKRIRDENTNQ